MAATGGNGTKSERRRERNRRLVAWQYRHPWRYSAIGALLFTGIMLAGQSFGDFPAGAWSVLVPVVAGLVLFVGGALITKSSAKYRDAVMPPDLTLRGSRGPAADEDGRRWRTGDPKR